MGSFHLMPTLPPYQNTAQYSQAPQPGDNSYLNSGDLGFFTLPVERTVGGFENNIYTKPQATQVFDPKTGKMVDLPFNPFLQGAFTGPKDDPTFTPYLPDKIIFKSPTTNLGHVPGGTGDIGQAFQTVNGQNINIGANNYAAGTSGGAPRPFETAPGTVSQQQDAPFSGFQFGEAGKPGGSFLSGTMENGKFYQQQPSSANPKSQQGLGQFTPWNPAMAALKQSRSQP